jgi:hypothetical protein
MQGPSYAQYLASEVRSAGIAIHTDGLAQSRWLLEASFLVGAAATARAELVRRLRDALRARAVATQDLDHASDRELLTAALCVGIIDPTTGSTLDKLLRRLSEFALGRSADPETLVACLDELTAASAALVAADEPTSA